MAFCSVFVYNTTLACGRVLCDRSNKTNVDLPEWFAVQFTIHLGSCHDRGVADAAVFNLWPLWLKVKRETACVL